MSYSWLAELSGLDVRGEDNNHLYSAKIILKRDGIAVFDVIPTVGLRRLRNEEIANHATNQHRKRFENDTRRYSHALGCVKVDALSDEKKEEYRYSRSILGIRQAIVAVS